MPRISVSSCSTSARSAPGSSRSRPSASRVVSSCKVRCRLAGIGNGTKTTRRWYYVIPAKGEPKKLVHAIESFNLDHLGGSKTIYSQRDTLASGLKAVLGGMKHPIGPFLGVLAMGRLRLLPEASRMASGRR